MSNPQQVAATGQQGPTPISNSEYRAFFSSAAITFSAMMAMLQAEQSAMNDEAQLAIKSTGARSNAMFSIATATQNMANNDASSLTQQGYAQWAQMGSNIAQGFSSAGGLIATARASSDSTNMNKLAEETSKFKNNANTTVGDAVDPNGNEADAAQKQVVATLRDKVLGGHISNDEMRTIIKDGGPDAVVDKNNKSVPGFDLRRLTNKNITENGLPGAVTLKDLYEGSSDAQCADMQSNMVKSKKSMLKDVVEKHENYKNLVTIGNAISGATSSGLSAQFKMEEAAYTRDKGAQALVQSLSQNTLSLAQETQKSQSDQAEKFNNLSGQVWQSINQLVQVDTRG